MEFQDPGFSWLSCGRDSHLGNEPVDSVFPLYVSPLWHFAFQKGDRQEKCLSCIALFLDSLTSLKDQTSHSHTVWAPVLLSLSVGLVESRTQVICVPQTCMEHWHPHFWSGYGHFLLNHLLFTSLLSRAPLQHFYWNLEPLCISALSKYNFAG